MVDLLILSDIRFIREGLTEVLGRDGAFQIAGAAVDVEEARELIGRSPPRVILVDTALPKGIDAVGTLRQLARDAKIVAQRCWAHWSGVSVGHLPYTPRSR